MSKQTQEQSHLHDCSPSALLLEISSVVSLSTYSVSLASQISPDSLAPPTRLAMC